MIKKAFCRKITIAFVSACLAAGAASAVPNEAEARNEIVFTGIPSEWPKGADRLFLEIRCFDDSEKTVVIAVNGGKGKNGSKKGFWSTVEILPPCGSLGCVIAKKRLDKRLDTRAMTNVTLSLEDGAKSRFEVVRAEFLAKDQEDPIVNTPPLRHPKDAAEHAVDFSAFKAACTQGDFVIGWATSMESVRPRAGFKWRKADRTGVRLARGEYESIQLLVAPASHDLKGVRVDVEMESAFASSNITACVVGYSETVGPPPYTLRPPKGGRMKRPSCGWYPDPILDFQKSCDISGNDVQSFWVRVRCPRTQKAGVFNGALVVSAEGAQPRRIPFSVRVNSFEVGRVSPLPLAVSVGRPGNRDPDDHWRNAWKKRPEQFCDFFADYFIAPDQLYINSKLEPHWDMLKRLRDQGRLNMFNLHYMWYIGLKEKDAERFEKEKLPEILARYEKAKELGIEKYAYLYGFDELGANVFTNINRTAELLHRYLPDVPVATTARDKKFGVDGSAMPAIDIHCPATCSWNPAQVDRARRAGRKVWWYFAIDPASPFANTMLEGPPCEIRSLMGAQTQKFKPDGFLYYSIAKWPAAEPIKSGPFTKWEPRSCGRGHGDGQWTCCGGPDNMPLATLRLENFRDGVEDLWYARILEEIYARVCTGKLREDEMILKEGGDVSCDEWYSRAQKLLDVPKNVVRSTAIFSTDPDVIYRWRDEMADLIEQAQRRVK